MDFLLSSKTYISLVDSLRYKLDFDTPDGNQILTVVKDLKGEIKSNFLTLHQYYLFQRLNTATSPLLAHLFLSKPLPLNIKYLQLNSLFVPYIQKLLFTPYIEFFSFFLRTKHKTTLYDLDYYLKTLTSLGTTFNQKSINDSVNISNGKYALFFNYLHPLENKNNLFSNVLSDSKFDQSKFNRGFDPNHDPYDFLYKVHVNKILRKAKRKIILKAGKFVKLWDNEEWRRMKIKKDKIYHNFKLEDLLLPREMRLLIKHPIKFKFGKKINRKFLRFNNLVKNQVHFLPFTRVQAKAARAAGLNKLDVLKMDKNVGVSFPTIDSSSIDIFVKYLKIRFYSIGSKRKFTKRRRKIIYFLVLRNIIRNKIIHLSKSVLLELKKISSNQEKYKLLYYSKLYHDKLNLLLKLVYVLLILPFSRKNIKIKLNIINWILKLKLPKEDLTYSIALFFLFISGKNQFKIAQFKLIFLNFLKSRNLKSDGITSLLSSIMNSYKKKDTN